MKAEVKFCATKNGPKAFVNTYDDNWKSSNEPLLAYRKDMRSIRSASPYEEGKDYRVVMSPWVLDDFFQANKIDSVQLVSGANLASPPVGNVRYANDENTLVADMICRTKEFDKFKSNVHYGYLYGCLLQVVLKAQQANATIIVAELGIDLQEWQWRKLKPILEHAVDETDKNVRVVVAAPYDLVEVEDDKEHHASKRKAKRSKDVPVAESKKNDSNEQLSLF